MALNRTDPLTAQDEPILAPLRESHEANQIEAELKALFIMMFDEFIRPGMREINTVGTPHLGPFSQVERAVKTEGLALYRRADEKSMRYLFRAWRARNPKRGLHMLRTYLQLMWPNGWSVAQLYQKKDAPYPTDLYGVEEPARYLTSRVLVGISTGTSTEADILSIVPALRSVVPARIVLVITLINPTAQDLAMGCAEYGMTTQRFEGNLV